MYEILIINQDGATSVQHTTDAKQHDQQYANLVEYNNKMGNTNIVASILRPIKQSS